MFMRPNLLRSLMMDDLVNLWQSISFASAMRDR